jgi:mono/diheme cytochrome c family protein
MGQVVCRRSIAALFLACAIALPTPADEPTKLAAQFTAEVRPLLVKYCQDCHGPETQEGELDLAAFVTWNDVRKQPQAWQHVGEMLDTRQMPPKDAPQLSDTEHAALQTWVRAHLTHEAASRAGDPGRVVLRRLSNAEYTYTIRDLTGIASLAPAREFPVDGAAGEGFSNTGSALVMSPALVTKYFDAGKEVASHMVLLPEGIRFSPHNTRSDWTKETLAEIRSYYSQFTHGGGGERVNLQGIVFSTNSGGRLSLEQYLAATLSERESIAAGHKSVADVAAERGLNAKYLQTLWNALTSEEPSLLLDPIRTRWKKAGAADAAAIANEIAAWQQDLWRFSTIGHIGKVGGPQRWMEPVDPITSKQEIRVTLPETSDEEIVLSLVASDAGDGNEGDYVVWNAPRFIAPGRPELLLKDVRKLADRLTVARVRLFADTSKYLAAADEFIQSPGKRELSEVARRHAVHEETLAAWLAYLGQAVGPVELNGHFTDKLTSAGDYDFVQGWGSHETPLLLANSSDRHVRIPGNMAPKSVVVHPSQKLRAAVGWKSPVDAVLHVSGAVKHAHPECGNGVAWWLELRRGASRVRLAAGTAQGDKLNEVGPLEKLTVRQGDVISLLVGPRDGNHSCDLTAIELKLVDTAEGGKTWNLAELSSDILAGNPHADRFGNKEVWHFYSEPDEAGAATSTVPPGSMLAQWQQAEGAARQKLADQVQNLLTSPLPDDKTSPDTILHRELHSLRGPLLATALKSIEAGVASAQDNAKAWGLAPEQFGKHPNGSKIDSASLCVQAPSAVAIRLPTDLVAGYEFNTSVELHAETGSTGSVQARVIPGVAEKPVGLLPPGTKSAAEKGTWTDHNFNTSYGSPILVRDGSDAYRRVAAGLQEFRQLFPAALCYAEIVPVDEVVTLRQFYREDDHLARLMLDEPQCRRLDQLWEELFFVSQDAFTQVDALQQLIEYATQDADPKVFEPLREPFAERAEAYRQQLRASEPSHLAAVFALAHRAYRRPLTSGEEEELRSLYARLRKEELPHEEAVRLVLARVLVSPAFLYKVEKPVEGNGQGPVSDSELATRLSYFLWSSLPDDELTRLAAEGRLQEPEVLRSQVRRMLADKRLRRLATEFACQWLHIYAFNELDEKSERHFPSFVDLRGDMYEESILFFTDLFQNGGSVSDILNADHTFLNEALARHYGIDGVTDEHWRRVEGVKRHARGGILAQATTLAKQSGASRTSPILRGNWVSEVLLGERLPRPPPGVPQLPDDEAGLEGLTVRQLVEKHSSDEKCAVCHRRIDPLGFALESYDAIGRLREKDLADRPIDTLTTSPEGNELEGLDGLRDYLLTVRGDAFTRQFCKKLLGYSLGRSVQLSDEPLLAELQAKARSEDSTLADLVEMIVLSRQFREIRGSDWVEEE